MNAPAIGINKSVREQVSKEDQMQTGVRHRYGLLEWPAMLRKLDRIDPSYRH